MRTIQMTIDDLLLKKLDADPEVKQDGRSAVLRRAAVTYLRRKRKRDIADAYRRAYNQKDDPEWAGWENEGTWPRE